MKKLISIGLLTMMGLSLILATPSDSSARRGHGAGWFIGGMALGAFIGSTLSPRVYYYRYPDPVYVYPAPPYAYREPVYVYPDPPVSYESRPSGEWVTVPGQWVGDQWVPEHRVWVSRNP